MVGDWNYVMHKRGRISANTGRASTHHDNFEKWRFDRWLVTTHGMVETDQRCFTWKDGDGRSRLDRCYQNQSVYFDSSLIGVALPWTTLSDHQPVLVGRQTPPPQDDDRPTRFPDWIFMDPHYADRVTDGTAPSTSLWRIRSLLTSAVVFSNAFGLRVSHRGSMCRVSIASSGRTVSRPRRGLCDGPALPLACRRR